ncbi:MAG TPA: hypothetical protein VFC51_17205 [Chloroflexota bacterium]|nr:hypothetical protein [Chloroflexota bacterium]
MTEVEAQTLQERAARTLRGIVEKYSHAEAEVVRVYFDSPHTAEEHVEVLLKQIGREIQGRQRLGPTITSMADRLERSVDRHEYAEFLRESTEEVEHYVALADLAEWVAGRELEPERLLGYEVMARYNPNAPDAEQYNPRLPEAGRNLDVGRDMVQALGYDRAFALMHCAEGGGGGAFAECAKLRGDEFQQRLATAMRKIVHDEMGHGPGRIDGYVRAWIHDEAELEQDARWLDAFMLAHLRVRNEIWGYPLSEQRIADLSRP